MSWQIQALQNTAKNLRIQQKDAVWLEMSQASRAAAAG
jgi:hypothetical protein